MTVFKGAKIIFKLRKYKKHIFISLLVFILLFAVLFDLFKTQNAFFSKGSTLSSQTSPALIMGGLVDVSLYGSNTKEISEEIFAAIAKDEKEILSWRIEGSSVYRINTAKEPVLIDDKTIEILNEIIDICGLTDGHLDLSIGEITRLWDFDSQKNSVPDEEKINNALKNVGYKNIKIDGKNVFIGGKAKIDLGAFGKGIACDTAKDVLQNTKIKGGIVSVGGSLLVYGRSKDKKGFNIGIRNPDGEVNDVFAKVLVDEECFISTSGMYERGFYENGEYYHHILDAKTGYPVKNELKSVSIFAKQGLLSDALSTACFILGYQNSLAILEKYECDAIFVFNDNSVIITNGISEKTEILNSDFKIRQQ